MKFLVAGVGAMGTRFALKLKQAGNDVTVVDGWDLRLKSLKKDGLCANLDGQEVVEHVPAYGQTELPNNLRFDVVLFLTKSMQLEQMVKDLLPNFDDHTMALCLMNGIGHEQTLEKYLSKEQVFLGNTMWTAQMTRPDHVLLEDDGSCELSNVVPGEPQASQAKQLVEVLDKAGLKCHLLADPRYSVFRKGCVNGTLNTLCTLFECNLEEFSKTSHAHKMVVEVVKEFAAVGAKEGINLDVDEAVRHVEDCYRVIGAHYPSMYQDLVKNNRRTEVDYINGYVASHGKKYGLKTPYCTLLTQEVHTKEDLQHAK